ncbi:MAG: Gfo/Idh/MocA family oxidoreductase [Acidipropionibacterium sp.]|jgi:predicted dehydrogenase|nr:Gfo/Idh/MocA family oxidoreductase [Acidipropionibacterium sp.]
MTEKKTIGAGIVSLGWMGRLHARAYRALGERFPEVAADIRLVSCCDVLEENRRQAVDVLGFERAVEDYHELINDPEVDVVDICAPNFLHHEIAMAAIEAGKPFWIEKPMGISAEQSADIARGAEAKGLITSVGFNYRHVPAVQYARQLIAEGRLGRITNARVWLIADYASDPKGPLTWRYEKGRAGAGVVLDLMGHGEDLVQYLLKDRITEVTALTDTFIDQRPKPLKAGIGHSGWVVSDELGPVENEDYCAIIARFSRGAVCTMESSRVSVGPRAEYIVEVYGTEGSIRWNFEDLNHIEVCLGRDNGAVQGYVKAMAAPDFPDFSRFQPGAGTSMGFDDMKVIEAAKFISGVLDQTQYGPSAADGWSAAEIDDAVVASASDHAWHQVRPVTGPTTYDK